MKFQVKFKGTDGRWSVEVKRREIGLKEVRAIREFLQVDLPLERIQGYVDSLRKDPVIVLNEEQAAKAGLFERKNTIVVMGIRGFLNHHTHPQVGYSKSKLTGGVEEAYLFPKILEEAVIEEWFSMGCPLEWPNDGVKPETEAETD